MAEEMPVKSHHQLDLHVYQQIEACITENPSAMLLIALSGGVDSMVLLNSVINCAKQFESLQINAVHVNHGVHPDTLNWAEHCRQACDELNVEFYLSEHDLKEIKVNREAIYREKRYQSFAQLLPEAGILLTAHHQNDQAETVLFNLFRGAGVSGLTGMKSYNRFAKGFQLRPLLSVPKKVIMDYAHQHRIKWIDDSSNFDTDLDRNYIRHEVLPVISLRWPAAQTTISRTAELLSHSRHLLDELAQQDIAACQSYQYPGVIKNAYLSVLDLSKMNQYSTPRKTNLLRHWLIHLCGLNLSAAQLEHIDEDLCMSSKPGLFEIDGIQIRSFKTHLYLMKQMLPLVNNITKTVDANGSFAFSVFKIDIQSQCNQEFDFKPRAGGEIILNNGQHQSVKNIFQQLSIPIWERELIPLVFKDNQLIAIPGVVLADDSPIQGCSISKIL